MNRKAFLIAALFFAIICCGSLGVWGMYSLLNHPAVKEGLHQASNEFLAMLDLQQKLRQTYQCDAGVQIMNGKILNISLINSKFNNISGSQQAKRAEEVARFVRQNYTGKANIVRIVINFVENMNLGPLNANRSTSYPFEVEELDKIISARGHGSSHE